MKYDLVNAIKLNTETMFINADIMLQTCDMDYVLCDMPIWKHCYHMLHSLDQWYINPKEYEHPLFHTENLNSLDITCEETLSKEQLQEYLQSIKAKITDYLNSLDDEMLYEIPTGCKQNRLGLIMSQFRHFYAHLGNINATTIVETNQWPRVVGITGKSGKSTSGLWEWFNMIEFKEIATEEELKVVLEMCAELKRLLISSINTAKQNSQ